MPKRGFRYKATGHVAPHELIHIEQLNQFQDGEQVEPARLKASGLLRYTESRIKLLGDGALAKRLTVRVHAASASAKAKVEQAGGRLELITTV